jgi:hypothetical protein
MDKYWREIVEEKWQILLPTLPRTALRTRNLMLQISNASPTTTEPGSAWWDSIES